MDSLRLWVSSLSYDPGKLHLSAGVHLEPVVSLLWLCAPRTTVQVIVVFRTLQLTTALFRTSLSSWLENKFGPQPRHYPNFPNQCWTRWKVMFTCMLSRPRWAENPWRDWEEASSWSSSNRWDSRPSGGQSWKNKMCFDLNILNKYFDYCWCHSFTFRFSRHRCLLQPLLFLLLPLLLQPLGFQA